MFSDGILQIIFQGRNSKILGDMAAVCYAKRGDGTPGARVASSAAELKRMFEHARPKQR